MIETITPLEMDTDGGSLPKLAQFMLNTSSWAYGPAYMIHDWEFAAHYMAQKDTSDVQNIYAGVMSPIGKHIWNQAS